MSSMLVCDVCGKPLEKPFYKLRITKHEENQESRDARTIKAIDMHDHCLELFKTWIKETRAKELAK